MLRGYAIKSAYTNFSSDELAQATHIIQKAQEHDVTTIINVGTDIVESRLCIELAQNYDNCYAIVGIHPNDTTERWQKDMKELSKLVAQKSQYKIIGIGECGIDLHYENYNLVRQQDAFKAQIELALEHDLALSIHSRDAAEETFKIIDLYKKESNFQGIMHCFSYDQGYANEAIKAGLVLGIGGTLTYPKNAILRAIAQTVDLHTIVLETDAPFLAPQAVRGKENCPAYMQFVAQFIADLRQTSYENVAKTTTQTVKRIFKLA
jgi:TatD DNase family protein